MYFSATTIAAVATIGLGLVEPVSAAVMDERGFSLFGNNNKNLCDKPNYGATGVPWNTNSQPGAFCGSNKPTGGPWKNIPTWDGGDSVKCYSIFSRWGLKVCSGGNKKGQLPWGCRPPKGHPKPPKPTKSSAAPSSAQPTAPASSVAVVIPSGNATSSAVPSSTPASVAPTSTSSAPADPAPSDDPTSDPVCDLTYQVQYQNYTLVAPNGYWYGTTVGSATQDGSYMTYTLATNVDDCLRACDDIEGCVFVNSYYDVFDLEANLPKHTPGVLTCAMFSQCVGTEKNDNWGGQDDPNYITNSNGYCKSGACGGA